MCSQKREPPLIDCLAADINEGSSCTVDFDNKITRYSRARLRAVNIISHVNEEYQSSGSPYLESVRDALIQCGNYLHFRHYPTVDQTRLHSASFCRKHLFCPLCAIRRASKSLSSYLVRYLEIRGKNPSLVPYMITLTVKNGDDLAERYDHLTKSVKSLNMRRTRALNGSRHKSEFVKVYGAVGSYEFTNIGNGWHPHVHIIALVDPNRLIDQNLLSQEWLNITGDSYIVDVRSIGNPDDPIAGFVEVFKYALKFSSLTYRQQIYAALTLKGKRLLFSIGLFRGVKVPDNLADKPLYELPYVDLFYRYIDGMYLLS